LPPGQAAKAATYRAAADGFAADWIRLADDGDHFRIQFNLASNKTFTSWSQKYNLLFDKVRTDWISSCILALTALALLRPGERHSDCTPAH
jgi:hypothetical protein